MSQLAAAAELFAEGRTCRHTAETASRFGNQAMLGLLENRQLLRDGISSASDILSGEEPPVFFGDARSAELTAENGFAPVSPPGFSADSPSADIMTVTGGL